MAGFWAEQKAFWTEEREVPGNRARRMRLWVFEVGNYLAIGAVLLLVSLSPSADVKGVEALPLMLVTFGAMVGSLYTGGYGLSYLLDKVLRKREPAKADSPAE